MSDLLLAIKLEQDRQGKVLKEVRRVVCEVSGVIRYLSAKCECAPAPASKGRKATDLEEQGRKIAQQFGEVVVAPLEECASDAFNKAEAECTSPAALSELVETLNVHADALDANARAIQCELVAVHRLLNTSTTFLRIKGAI